MKPEASSSHRGPCLAQPGRPILCHQWGARWKPESSAWRCRSWGVLLWPAADLRHNGTCFKRSYAGRSDGEWDSVAVCKCRRRGNRPGQAAEL